MSYSAHERYFSAPVASQPSTVPHFMRRIPLDTVRSNLSSCNSIDSICSGSVLSIDDTFYDQKSLCEDNFQPIHQRDRQFLDQSDDNDTVLKSYGNASLFDPETEEFEEYETRQAIAMSLEYFGNDCGSLISGQDPDFLLLQAVQESILEANRVFRNSSLIDCDDNDPKGKGKAVDW
jgi:hypothetical protein